MRLLFKYLLLISGAFLLFLLFFIAYLTTPPGEEIMRRLIIAKFNQSFDQKLDIVELETNIFSRLSADGISLSPYDEDGNRLLNLAALRIEYRLSDLLIGRLTVHSIALDSLYVALDRDSSGNFNLPRFIAAKPEGKNLLADIKIDLSQAEIRRSTLEYEDDVVSIDGSVRRMELLIMDDDSGGYDITVGIDSISAEYRDFPLSVWNLRLDANWRNQTLRVDQIECGLPGFDVSGKCAAAFKDEDIAVEGNLRFSGAPDELALAFDRLLPELLKPLSGELVIDLSAAGNLPKPTLRAQVEFPRLTLNQTTVYDGSAVFIFNEDSVNIESISLRAMNGIMTGSGLLLLDSLLTHRLQANLRDFSLEEIQELLTGRQGIYSGLADGSFQSRGELRKPETLTANCNLNIKNIVYDKKSIPGLTTSLTVGKGSAELYIQQGSAEIHSTLTYAENRIKGSFTAKIPNVEQSAGLLNLSGVAGKIYVNGLVEGALDSAVISADFSGQGLSYQKFPLDSIFGSAVYQHGIPELGKTFFYGRLDSIGVVQAPLDLSDVRGGLSYSGNLSGRLDELRGSILVNLDNPAYKSFRYDRGTLSLVVEGGETTMEAFTFENDSLLIKAAGVYTLKTSSGNLNLGLFRKTLPVSGDDSLDTPRPEYSLKEAGRMWADFDFSDRARMVIKAAGADLCLCELPAFIGYSPSASGKLNFTLAFSGSASHPEGEIDFNAVNILYKEAFLDSIFGRARITEEKAIVDFLNIFSRGNSLNAGGEFGLTRDDDGKPAYSPEVWMSGFVRADSIDISVFSEFLPSELGFSGILNCGLNWKGTLRKPKLNGNLNLTGGSFSLSEDSTLIEALRLQVRLIDTTLIVDNFEGIVRKKLMGLTGKISSGDLENFNANFTLTVSGRKALTGAGVLMKDSLDFDLRTVEFDLAMLQGMSASLSTLQGKLNTTMKIKGPVSNPDIFGSLVADDINFQPPTLDAPLTGGRLRIKFDKYNVNLDSLSFLYKEGRIFASGRALRSELGFSEFSLKISSERLTFKHEKQYVITIRSVELNYTLLNEKYNLEGDIILGESRLLYRFQPQMLLTLLQKSERPRPQMPEMLQKTRFNVRLRESDNIWIDNNLAKLRLNSELSLTGSPVNPNITGRLSVDEGYVIYLDRKFQVQTGVLDFIDPVKPNPIITLEAETEVRNYQAAQQESYKITLNITGTMENPVVNLQSEPPLDKSDILSLLTLGFIREGSVVDGSAGKGATITDAVQDRLMEYSSARISGYVSRKAESALGLTQVTVNGSLFSISNSSGPQLLASKKLSERMEITYITTIGHLNEQGIRLDYRLSRVFSLEGQTDQRGNSGIDLKYRIKF